MDGGILKIPSTRIDPGRAIRSGIAQLADVHDTATTLLAHGTTVATNALLERRGATVALVTTLGFADVIEIGRQNRPSLYDPWADRPVPLVERDHRLEVVERLDATGAVLVPYQRGSCPTIPDGIDAVAVCLLHADLDPVHEIELAGELRALGFDVSVSHEVSPEFREFERTITTVVNAYLRPICGPYLAGLADIADRVEVMTSGGGLVGLGSASELPASLLLSGPAAGVRAAAAVATVCGFPDAISFDMGGTSTDVCLILDGAPTPANLRSVADLPIRLPSLDVHTIGAGGGSIAALDAGGALTVGPESAGADPGPACYGHGGSRPTVTDANLVAGRIPPETTFPGLGRLDVDAAGAALEAAGVSAAGVIDVVNAHMERALRAVSVERGVDPSELALIAFGGAGPLHACALAESVGISTVIVPGAAGVLSAVGLLTSPRRRELVRSWSAAESLDGLDRALTQLGVEAAERLSDGSGDVTISTSVDCRYAGQSHELRVVSLEEFPAEHLRRNGYDRPGETIEVTALRAVAERPAPTTIEAVLAGWGDSERSEMRGPEMRGPEVRGSEVRGPEVMVRDDCTIWLPANWIARQGPLGAWILSPEEVRP